MTPSYEDAARLKGEIRVYIETATQADLYGVKSQLGYQYAFERPHRAPADPWECAFGDPRVIRSEVEFARERDRVIGIFTTGLPTGWKAEVMYHKPGHASASWHWSSTEGMLTPYQIENPIK